MFRRYWWPLLMLAVGLPVALYAVGVRLPWRGPDAAPARAEPVPDGDQEMAWIHTTTAGTTWERFVSGLKRTELAVAGLQVDDTFAFPEQTTAVPEVVLRMPGRGGSLHVRWYKLTSETTAVEWVQALARRDPAPLALIGGGSSDRAADLARALAAQTDWHGDRPLLLITTATADSILEGPDEVSRDPRRWPKLIDVYDDRSFRFCFTNRQMAEAVADFALHDGTLRPGPAVWPGFRAVPMAAAGGWAALAGLAELWADTPAPVFLLAWKDDPYSVDLSGQFKDVLFDRLGPHRPPGPGPRLIPRFFNQEVEFSVGSYYRPNRHEAEAADAILGNLPPRGQRGLLVIPTVAPPARRVLKTLAEGQPRIGRRLVALTGDGISVNTIYRDADLAWPIRTLQIPLVMFTHNNPFGWDTAGGKAPPPGYELHPPNSTEDVLHFAELGRVVTEAAFPHPDDPVRVPVRGGVVNRADGLLRRLKERTPPFFDTEGDRLGRSGEHVVVLRPNFDPVVPGRPRPDGTIEAYRRSPGSGWARTRPPLPVFQEPRADGRHPE